jgi:transposase
MLGKSGRDMLDALAGGEQHPDTVADLARGRLRGKLPALRRALHGQVQSFQRVLLQQVLAHLDFRDVAIAHLQHAITLRLEPYQEAVTLLQTIPGVGAIAASVVVAPSRCGPAALPVR